MAKKRLAYYIENYDYGGLEKFVMDLLAGSVTDDYEVTFYCNSANIRFIDELKKSRISEKVILRTLDIPDFISRCYRMVNSHKGFARKLFFGVIVLSKYPLFIYDLLYLCLKLERFDVFHAINGGYPAADSCRAAVMAARIKRSDVIIMSVLSTAYAREKVYAVFERIVDRIVERSVTYIHVNSKAAGTNLVSKRGFRADKVINIYTGIAISDNVIQKRPGGIGPITVGVVSSLTAYKGHKYLIEAAGIIRKKYGKSREFKYLIIGDGSCRKQLEEFAKEFGVFDIFNFYGYYPGPLEVILNEFDIFVFPSLQESFPYAIMEAMRMSLPIVATCIAGIPEQIVDRQSGLLVPPGDSRALADSIVYAAENPEIRGKLGRNAYERVRKLFDVKNTIDEIRNLYNKKINSKPT